MRNAIVHEAALSRDSGALLGDLSALTDSEISARCDALYSHMMNENAEAWRSLGADFHARLTSNYVTWVRRYLAAGLPASYSAQQIHSLLGIWAFRNHPRPLLKCRSGLRNIVTGGATQYLV